MRVDVLPAPWNKGKLSKTALEGFELFRGAWREAATRYTSIYSVRSKSGRNLPKGVQKYLNQVLEERFTEAGWDAIEGRFRKGDTWIRVTFRHQMSLGSDLIDAIRICKKEGVKEAIILAGSDSFLRLVTPKDAAALVNYEKLANDVTRLNGVLDIPLYYGQLSQESKLHPDANKLILSER